MAQTAWMKHLLAFKKQHPGISLGEAMKKAKGSYKKQDQPHKAVKSKTHKKRKGRKSKKSKKSRKPRKSRKSRKSRK